MTQFLTTTLPCLYLALAGMCAGAFLSTRGVRMTRTRRALVALALVLHAWLLLSRWQDADGMPEFGGWHSLSPLALVVVAMFAALGQRERGGLGTSAVVYSIVFVLQWASASFGDPLARADEARPAMFYLVHVASILVASAALILSGIHGLLYLLLYRTMRQRKFGRLFEGLPSLSELARQMRRAAAIAFVWLLIGVNGGIWWAHTSKVTGFNYRDPLVLILIALMAHFGVVAASGSIPGITARRASWAATVGLFALAVSLGFSLLPHGFHAAP